NRVGGEVLAHRIDIGDHRLCSPHHRAARRSDERAAGHDDFVPSAYAENMKGELERDGSVCERDGGSAGDVCRVFAVEQPRFLSGPVVHLAGYEDANRCLDLVLRVVGPGSERRVAKRIAALDREAAPGSALRPSAHAGSLLAGDPAVLTFSGTSSSKV